MLRDWRLGKKILLRDDQEDINPFSATVLSQNCLILPWMQQEFSSRANSGTVCIYGTHGLADEY